MAMLLFQPASCFGDCVCEELELAAAGNRNWNSFEFAVAWINQSGASHVEAQLKQFLGSGGRVRAVVGLDFASTSAEGLGLLLSLEVEGSDIETYVFHDENRACTFHPKVYLFTGANEALLYVGSNNMTGGGLASNIEASMGFWGALDDGAMRMASSTLEAWRQDPLSRSRRLTPELLEELQAYGYVRTEEEIRSSRSVASAKSSPKEAKLFGRSKSAKLATAKKILRKKSGGSPKVLPKETLEPKKNLKQKKGSEEVLLMRIKPRRNGGQVQISMDILDASFMHGAKEVVLVDGTRRKIGYNLVTAVVNGKEVKKKNTARFEAPEMKKMKNPVALFRRAPVKSGESPESDAALLFEVFDAAVGAEGRKILRKLEEGISTPPNTALRKLSRLETVLSKPDRDSAQWYRLDLV